MEKKSVKNSRYKQTDSLVCQSQRGKIFYYVATCILLLLLIDRPYNSPSKGFRKYLRKLKWIFKQFFVHVLCGVFKCVDKYYRTK